VKDWLNISTASCRGTRTGEQASKGKSQMQLSDPDKPYCLAAPLHCEDKVLVYAS